MKSFFLYLLPLFLLQGSCKKEAPDWRAYAKNNELKAMVLLSSGNTVTINAKGIDATMDCGLFGGGTFINGVDPSKAGIYINVHGNNFSCVTAPGTYPLDCQYVANIQSVTSPNYSSFASSNKGSITFTQVDNKHMEGFFNSVCSSGNDSVIIN